MATQRITLAKVAGEGSNSILNLVRAWSNACTEGGAPASVQQAIDAFVLRLKAESAAPPVIYFCEWIDYWSMGDDFPATASAAGDRFEITCLSAEEAQLFAKQRREDTQEQQWLANHLRECASAWNPQVQVSIILLIREVLGPSVTERSSNRKLNLLLGSVTRNLMPSRSCSIAYAVTPTVTVSPQSSTRCLN